MIGVGIGGNYMLNILAEKEFYRNKQIVAAVGIQPHLDLVKTEYQCVRKNFGLYNYSFICAFKVFMRVNGNLPALKK